MTEGKTPVSYSYTFGQLNISERKLADLMGYSDFVSTPEPVLDSMKSVLDAAEGLCHIKGGYVISDDPIIDRENKRIFSHDNWFETKQIVTQQLRRSEQLAWFICTAGEELTNYSKQQTELGDPVKGYVVDVLANIVVDSAMDLIQEELKTELAKKGHKITNRYSPGYCDWNIAEQKKLFQAFPENYLGISLTESCLMIPVKSISGVIGIGKDVHYNDYTCNLCDDLNCYYRNKGRMRSGQ